MFCLNVMRFIYLIVCHAMLPCRTYLVIVLHSIAFLSIVMLSGIMEEACSSRSLQDNKTDSPSQVVY